MERKMQKVCGCWSTWLSEQKRKRVNGFLAI
jgi:hypothetical protein